MPSFTVLVEFLTQGVLLFVAIGLALYYGLDIKECSVCLPKALKLLLANAYLGGIVFLALAYTAGMMCHAVIFWFMDGVCKIQGKVWRNFCRKRFENNGDFWKSAIEGLTLDGGGKKKCNWIKKKIFDNGHLQKFELEDAQLLLNTMRDYILVTSPDAYKRNLTYRNEFRIVRGLLIPLFVLGLSSILISKWAKGNDKIILVLLFGIPFTYFPLTKCLTKCKKAQRWAKKLVSFVIEKFCKKHTCDSSKKEEQWIKCSKIALKLLFFLAIISIFIVVREWRQWSITEVELYFIYGSPLAIIVTYSIFCERLERYYKMVLNSFGMSCLCYGPESRQRK